MTQNTSSAVTLTGGDVEGATLTFRVSSQPTHGLLSGTAPDFIYTPDSAYVGADSFSYVSNDGELDAQIATVAITVSPVVVTSTVIALLNDTGITFGGNYPSGNNTSCIGETIAQQDCSRGRDVTHNDDSDGPAGFSYTKLDADGNGLLASATEWSCVKDNVTGLIWEVKVGGNELVGDEGLHDGDDGYNWYNTDPTTNGGENGFSNDDGAVCFGYDASDAASYCNTQAYVARVNMAGLCGATDWRLPSKVELLNLTNLNNVNPVIDTAYFSVTRSTAYWSSSPYARDAGIASFVNFNWGYTGISRAGEHHHVRLVRVGQ